MTQRLLTTELMVVKDCHDHLCKQWQGDEVNDGVHAVALQQSPQSDWWQWSQRFQTILRQSLGLLAHQRLAARQVGFQQMD